MRRSSGLARKALKRTIKSRAVVRWLVPGRPWGLPKRVRVMPSFWASVFISSTKRSEDPAVARAKAMALSLSDPMMMERRRSEISTRSPGRRGT